jgi:hypothetical protein
MCCGLLGLIIGFAASSRASVASDLFEMLRSCQQSPVALAERFTRLRLRLRSESTKKAILGSFRLSQATRRVRG